MHNAHPPEPLVMTITITPVTNQTF